MFLIWKVIPALEETLSKLNLVRALDYNASERNKYVALAGILNISICYYSLQNSILFPYFATTGLFFLIICGQKWNLEFLILLLSKIG